MNGKFRINWRVERQDQLLRKALETLPLEALLTVRNRNPQRPNAPRDHHNTTQYFSGVRFSVTKEYFEPHYVISPLPTADVKEVKGYEQPLSTEAKRVNPEFEFLSARQDAMQVNYAGRKFTLLYSNSRYVKRK
jgi:hypothetical protein